MEKMRFIFPEIMYLTHSKGVFGVVQIQVYEVHISYLVVFILKRCVKYQKYIIMLMKTSGDCEAPGLVPDFYPI